MYIAFGRWPVRAIASLIMTIFAASANAATTVADPAAMMAAIEAPQSPARSELDAMSLAALLAHLKVPGASVAVVRDFKLHWAKGYGVADVETGRLVDTGTRFQSASISKPVTALAAMRLVQQGRLDLDADINTVLRSWRLPATAWSRTQAVTARALMSHTSGADDGFGFPGYAPKAPIPSVLQILQGHPASNVRKITFARAPYEASKYSGGGWIILQQALVDLQRQPFSQFMKATVLDPLQMADSSFDAPVLIGGSSRAAMAHDKEGQRMGAPWHIYPEQAAAGLWTTPGDLARFMLELQTALRGPKGKVLEQRLAREMLSPVGVGRYGLGPVIDQRAEGWYFSHSGDNWGYRAWISGHLRKGYGVVIMVNGENGMALMNQIADRVERAYDWDSIEKED